MINDGEIVVLVDALETLFGFGASCHEYLMKIPMFKEMPMPEIRYRHIKDNHEPEIRPFIEHIYRSKGFIRNLPLIDGAYEAMEKMLVSKIYDPYICTKPYYGNRFYETEIVQAIIDKLPDGFRERTIIAPDKTMVFGHVLIDDNPQIKGMRKPCWEHFVFEQPYNLNTKSPRINWDNWEEILENEIEKIRPDSVTKSLSI